MFFAFTPMYDENSFPWRNRIVPKTIYIMLQLIYIIIPSAKCVLYIYFVFKTDMMDHIVGPWLLGCSVNCIFILLVWYRNHIMPWKESSKALLEDEYRWEKERL